MGSKKKIFLYDEIAEIIEQQIIKGTLKTGDKLMSVRMLSKEQNISLSTAFKVYSILETRGFIEARPKSGYYVKHIPLITYKKNPVILNYNLEPKDINKTSITELISKVYDHQFSRKIAHFGFAAPYMDLYPSAKLKKIMLKTIRECEYGCAFFESNNGNERLRNQIAKCALSWRGIITKDDVITTNGGMASIELCLRVTTKPGDTVAIETPSYFILYGILKDLGLKIIEIPCEPGVGLNFKYLTKAIKRDRIKACIFIPNFNNPMGSLMSDENKKQLVEIITEHKIPLIEDDANGELYFGKKRPLNCKSFDKQGWVLLCSSISKTLAPGLRVGWCIPGRFKENILKYKQVHVSFPSTPAEIAIAHFFETERYDLHMRNMRKNLYARYLQYIRLIYQYFPKDTIVSQPQGGCVLWIEMNKKINTWKLYENAIKHNILITPGKLFSLDDKYKHCMRISYGSPIDSFTGNCIKILGKLAHEMVG